MPSERPAWDPNSLLHGHYILCSLMTLTAVSQALDKLASSLTTLYKCSCPSKETTSCLLLHMSHHMDVPRSCPSMIRFRSDFQDQPRETPSEIWQCPLLPHQMIIGNSPWHQSHGWRETQEAARSLSHLLMQKDAQNRAGEVKGGGRAHPQMCSSEPLS